jgi:hypothetical protein
MLRKLWAAAAVAGALAAPAFAGDDAVKLGRFQPGSNADYAGAPEGAGPANDTERTHWYRGGWGYRPYWGGYYGGFYGGYRSFYYGGSPYWGGYNFYRPAFAFYPSYYYYPSFGYSYYSAGFFPISGGTSASTSARTVTLGMTRVPKEEYASDPAPAPATAAPAPQPAPETFRYDGGPSNPAPLPVTTTVKSKYQYTAYGEKR